MKVVGVCSVNHGTKPYLFLYIHIGLVYVVSTHVVCERLSVMQDPAWAVKILC